MDAAALYERFPSQADCLAFLEKIRWPDRPVCPYCGRSRSSPRPKEQRHFCNACGKNFRVTVKTPFHQLRVPLQKALLATILMMGAAPPESEAALAGEVDSTPEAARDLMKRVRDGLANEEQRAFLTTVATALTLDRAAAERGC